MTQGHCGLENRGRTPITHGEGVNHPRPRESVFLGYSTRLWLNVGNDAIYCTSEGDYAMPSENMLYAFENMLNAFEICQEWKLYISKHRRHANRSRWSKLKQTDLKTMLESFETGLSLLEVLDAGMYSVQR